MDQTRVSFEESERFTDVNGFTVHTNEAGSGPVLFGFHGGGPGANAWDNTKHNIDELSKHFQVILFDLPGYGGSGKEDIGLEGESRDRTYARLVLSFMDVRGIRKASLYAASASAPSALRFGIDNPDRIEKIVLAAGNPGGPNWFSPAPAQGIQALNEFSADPTYENMVRIMKNFVPRANLLTEDMIKRRFEMAMIPGHLEARARDREARNSDLLSDLNRLKAPVLVVWGHQDRMSPMEGALKDLASIPDVRVHIWGGGTGHFVGYEQKDEFNRLVIDFLTH
jgi:pimeloyl-ACP methyl ester carboxylesterase